MTRKRKQGFVEMVSLSAYSTPTVQENRVKGYVEYRLKTGNAKDKKYDVPNGYYLYLYDRAKGSTTNGAIIKGMCDMIYGRGLDILDAPEDSPEVARIKEIISSKDLKRAISDRKKLMMCALQVTKNGGEVTDVTYFPMKDLLPEIKTKDGDIENWYYHPNWAKIQNGNPTPIPAYGFGETSGNEILVIGNYNGESEYFCEDEGYVGALPYALLEEEIADYQINDAQNGFSPTTIVNYNNGVPDDEQIRKDLVRKTKNTLTGSAGKR